MIEDAGEGLGEPRAVVGVGDERAPALGDAPAAAEGPVRYAREDLDEEVVREQRRRVRLPRPPGPLLRAGATGHHRQPPSPPCRRSHGGGERG